MSEQQMTIGEKSYPVGTARRGTGNRHGSYKTPVGKMVVIRKWEPHCPTYHGRIRGKKLWLSGDCCPATRYIYIHRGRTGRPTSLGCIHLQTEHLDEVFATLDIGSTVEVRP